MGIKSFTLLMSGRKLSPMTETELAEVLYKALKEYRASDTDRPQRPLVVHGPESALIDGTFDLRAIAAIVLKEMSR